NFLGWLSVINTLDVGGMADVSIKSEVGKMSGALGLLAISIALTIAIAPEVTSNDFILRRYSNDVSIRKLDEKRKKFIEKGFLFTLNLPKKHWVKLLWFSIIRSVIVLSGVLFLAYCISPIKFSNFPWLILFVFFYVTGFQIFTAMYQMVGKILLIIIIFLALSPSLQIILQFCEHKYAKAFALLVLIFGPPLFQLSSWKLSKREPTSNSLVKRIQGLLIRRSQWFIRPQLEAISLWLDGKAAGLENQRKLIEEDEKRHTVRIDPAAH
ncbi:MAG: hypothetical protein ACRCSF_13085, partial [Mycobacteriaceae bacterium]